MSQTALVKDLTKILGRRLIGRSASADFVGWAIHELEVGQDLPALRVIAGLASPVNEFELDEWVRRLWKELGHNTPSKEELLQRFAVMTAEEIVAGQIPVLDGAKRMAEIAKQSESIVEWIGLYEDLVVANDCADDGEIGVVESRVLATAKQLAPSPH